MHVSCVHRQRDHRGDDLEARGTCHDYIFSCNTWMLWEAEIKIFQGKWIQSGYHYIFFQSMRTLGKIKKTKQGTRYQEENSKWKKTTFQATIEGKVSYIIMNHNFLGNMFGH